MTTEEFAAAAGVSVSALSRFERNETESMAGTVRRIELAFKRLGIAFADEPGRTVISYPASLDDADAEALAEKRKR